jgi:four helix bundle protein
MFLNLNHQNLDIYKLSRKFVVECYKVTKEFPHEERYCITQQIRRAAISVYLNIAEGCSRKSQNERKRYFEISRGSMIEIDAAMEIVNELGYISLEKIQNLGSYLVRCFSMISKMIK